MTLSEHKLRQIAFDVCRTMLGLEPVPADTDLELSDPVTASVEIHGRCHRIVELMAPTSLTVRLAEAMFDAEPGTLSDDEVRDAFGEITNMIGGNAKACFGEDAELSQPVVRQTDDWIVSILQSNICTSFECCGDQMSIVFRELSPSVRSRRMLTKV